MIFNILKIKKKNDDVFFSFSDYGISFDRRYFLLHVSFTATSADRNLFNRVKDISPTINPFYRFVSNQEFSGVCHDTVQAITLRIIVSSNRILFTKSRIDASIWYSGHV
jgi:alkyl hydroperoxide reductase subunit AhpF